MSDNKLSIISEKFERAFIVTIKKLRVMYFFRYK